VLDERARTLAAGTDPWATPKGRCAALAKVLSATTRVARDAALASVNEHDPEAGEQVRSEMFLFEDVGTLDAQDMRKVVSAVDTQTLALALKTASDEIKEAVFKAISKRAAETVREEQEMLGPRPLSEVEGAQQVFVDTVLRLQEEGEITVRRGEEEELV
jgi:flagellar motor switch protein FliG